MISIDADMNLHMKPSPSISMFKHVQTSSFPSTHIVTLYRSADDFSGPSQRI